MYNMDYTEKYIKYKKKYLKALKLYNQKAGMEPKPKLIAFTANWCIHCKTFTPLFKKMESEYSNKIDFVNYDSEKNKSEIEKFQKNIVGYPTIYLQFGKKLIEYNDQRDKNNILSFINKHTNINL